MINLNLKPSEDCELCDHEYICFDCEKEQVKKQYPIPTPEMKHNHLTIKAEII